MNEVNPQKKHYESIHDIYENSYYDEFSMKYRKKFIYDIFFLGIDFNGCNIADIASGSGHNSLYYLNIFPNSKVHGYDISKYACKEYQERVKSEAFECDLTKPIDISKQYEAVIVVGGLHHCVIDLNTTLKNIAKMVKPGGCLIMYEPNKEYLLESLRKLWYKKDKYFEQETEEALSHKDILEMTQGAFELYDVKYLGGPAYFLILNSMIFRIPFKVKRIIAPSLFFFERIFNKIAFCSISPIFIARWKRTDIVVE
tara:strand:+ start:3998 stop:4765 length:768 start_codon:yes stop_codon:yes gene_type:complete